MLIEMAVFVFRQVFHKTNPGVLALLEGVEGVGFHDIPPELVYN